MIDFASTKAARYACDHWHYSDAFPVGKTVKIGLWEDETFRGVAVFSSGAGQMQMLGSQYGLERENTCELARVALRDHEMPVSQFVGRALRMLHETNPGLQLVISYADPAQGHVGRIYQAMNWIYSGTSAEVLSYRLGKRWVHKRTVYGMQFGSVASAMRPVLRTPEGRPLTKNELRNLPTRRNPGKFRYYYPFERWLRRRLVRDALPYPGDDDLAAQVSKAKRRASRSEGEVQPLGAAPTA